MPLIDTFIQKYLKPAAGATKGFFYDSANQDVKDSWDRNVEIVKMLGEGAKFLARQPLEFGASIAELPETFRSGQGSLKSYNSPVGAVKSYQSQAQEALNQGAKPFGWDAFGAPAVNTVFSGLDAGAASKLFLNAAEATALESAKILAVGGRSAEAGFAKLPMKLTENRTIYTPPVYKETGDLTTKILKKLEGRSEVSKQFISDLTNSPDLKQTEKDIIRNVLAGQGDKVAVGDFAQKVKGELLPLERTNSGMLVRQEQIDKAMRKARISGSQRDWKEYENLVVKNEDQALSIGGKYESISLPEESRGSVANYSEHIYNSPIPTSAGKVHWGNAGEISDNYFGHTRVEDLPNSSVEKSIELGVPVSNEELVASGGTTRRVIEVQSDLYQKGNLEREFVEYRGQKYGQKDVDALMSSTDKFQESAKAPVKKLWDEKKKLQQYNDPTAHFRMVREEVKQAAIDGKTKLQFPTGGTAMKIEGLGNTDAWRFFDERGYSQRLGYEDLAAGRELHLMGLDDKWVVTDVLGDGKFKAVPKESFYDSPVSVGKKIEMAKFEDRGYYPTGSQETFDISGKVDTNNPIYKFYEKDLGKYLKGKYDAKLVTDKQGVQWYELDIKPEHGRMPVEAFGMLPFLPMGKKEEKQGLFIKK